MTNVPPPPPGDVPPPAGNVPPAGSVPPPPPAPGAAPYGTPAPGPSQYSAPGPGPSPYAAPTGGTSPKQGLSLTSFIVGLAGLLILSWIPILGILVGVAAVVIGFMAKGREPGAPQWMWIVGVIAGFLTILISLIVTIFLFGSLAFLSSVSNMPTSP